jgi:hypothetical protein
MLIYLKIKIFENQTTEMTFNTLLAPTPANPLLATGAPTKVRSTKDVHLSVLVFLREKIKTDSLVALELVQLKAPEVLSAALLTCQLDPQVRFRCVLCCAVLCCAVLCCAVLCCAVLCCAVLCCAVLCCAVLCCAILYYR